MKTMTLHSKYAAAHSSLIAVLCLLLTGFAHAQEPTLQWAVQSSGPDLKSIRTMTVDGDGNTIVAIVASQAFTFAGVQIPHVNQISDYTTGTTIIKLDPDGQVLWHRSLKGQWQNAVFCDGLDTDEDNNVYVSYSAYSNFINASTIGGLYVFSPRPLDHFFLKLSPDGQGLWYKVANIFSNLFSFSSPICKTAPDGVYNLGLLLSTVNIGGQMLTNTGLGSMYLVKHDHNGNLLWAKVFGNILGRVSSRRLITDEEGSVYISGNWEGDALIVDDLSIENDLAFTGNDDRWHCKLGPDGSALWLAREHSSGSEGQAVLALTPDADLLTLSMNTDVALQAGDFEVSGAGIVLTRYNAAGEVIAASMIGEEMIHPYVFLPRLSSDGSGAYYFTGTFSTPTYTLGGLTVQNTGATSGTTDIILAKLDADGQAAWIYTVGSEESEYGLEVIAAAEGRFVLGSIFEGVELNIQGTTLTAHTPFEREVVLASFNTTLATRSAEALKQLLAYPNPFAENVHFDADALQAFQNASLTIFNSSGTEVYRAQLQGKDPGQFNLGHLPKGAYVARISDGAKSLHTKIVKQ